MNSKHLSPLPPFPLSNQISILYKFHYRYLILNCYFYIIIIILFNYIFTTNIITGKIVEKIVDSR